MIFLLSESSSRLNRWLKLTLPQILAIYSDLYFSNNNMKQTSNKLPSKQINQANKISSKSHATVSLPNQKEVKKESAEMSLIDDIFKSAKKTKMIQKQAAKKDDKKAKLQQRLKRQWKIEEQLRKAGQGNVMATNKVESGIKIYTEEELNIGKGGNTKLCPIDCQCCF